MSDIILLYCGTGICISLILLSLKYNRTFALVNIAICLLYSSMLYYGLMYKGEYGSGFLWFFYLAIATVIQIIIVGGYIIAKLIKSKKEVSN